MKAISLWQPWASLMAMGLKKVETRHWPTRYRGPLLIHAAKKFVPPDSGLIQDLVKIPLGDLPRGCLLCKVELIGCHQVNADNRPWEPECSFGNYEIGRYMWITDNLETFDPIPFRGSQGIFEVPDDLLKPL